MFTKSQMPIISKHEKAQKQWGGVDSGRKFRHWGWKWQMQSA